MVQAKQRPVLSAVQLCNLQVHCADPLICPRVSKFRRAAASPPRCAARSCDNLPPPENTNPANLCVKRLANQISPRSRGFPSWGSRPQGTMRAPAFPDSAHTEHKTDPCFDQLRATIDSCLLPSEFLRNARLPCNQHTEPTRGPAKTSSGSGGCRSG